MNLIKDIVFALAMGTTLTAHAAVSLSEPTKQMNQFITNYLYRHGLLNYCPSDEIFGKRLNYQMLFPKPSSVTETGEPIFATPFDVVEMTRQQYTDLVVEALRDAGCKPQNNLSKLQMILIFQLEKAIPTTGFQN